jgi:hypothetical protein
MYFPYLRGKQFEFQAVRELAQKRLLYKNDLINIIPIFEPVKNDFRQFDQLITNNIIFGIIVNPKAVKLDYSLIQNYVLNNETYNNNFFVCILVDSSNQNEVLNYKNIYQNFNKIYIHKKYNHILANNLSIFNDGVYNFVTTSIGNIYNGLNNQVILEDSFDKLDRNADYPLESYFNNYYLTYKQLGYIGISDYLTIGEAYSETGGTPIAVAIHLSILQNKAIYIKHFVSDNTVGRGDVSVKFTQAVTKLANFVIQNNITYTEGIKEFLNWASTNHFPGLGSVKKASMKNHIELMNILI